MSLSATTTKINYPGPGGTVFTFPYPVQAAGDIEVYRTDPTTGDITGSVLVLNTDYTLAGVGGASCTVTLTADLGSFGLFIRRVVDITQDVVLENGGVYYPKIHERQFDKLTMIDQQQEEQLGRSLHLPESLSGVSTVLPLPVAGAALAWNATEDGLGNLLGGSAGTLEDAKALTLAALASTGDPALGDALVGVKQPFTGAAARTVHEKIAEFVSVTDFSGSDKTGVTDSTGAIIAAIATGKAVFFPAGTYQMGPVDLANAGQTIFGEGAASVIVQKVAGGHGFTVKAGYVTIRDIRMNGVETNAANTNFAVFTTAASPAPYMVVSNVVFSGVDTTKGWPNAVKFDDGINYGTVINCRFERLWGITSGHGYGVLTGNVVGAHIIANHYIGSTNRGRHGVYISGGASECLVHGNFIRDCQEEGISHYSTSAIMYRNIISNNMLMNCCAAGDIAASGAIGVQGPAQGCIVSDNVVCGSVQAGIRVDGTGFDTLTDIIVANNNIINSDKNGINLIRVNRAVISGNSVRESGYTTVGTYANIAIRSDGTKNCADLHLTGNQCTGPVHSRGSVSVDPGNGGPTNTTFVGNQFNFCTAGGYNLELNGVVVTIDGRIQFRQNSVAIGPITNGSMVQAGYTVTGATQGDTVVVNHTSNQDGCILYGYVSTDNTVQVIAANFSGAGKTIASGTLRIDVWKRAVEL